ncbi:MAG TPA: DUF4199 domain-containing protein [Ohtaekwangia sp.]|nr:DUF4199 domain-containing protein [Ohtaekwangia sp.]
MKRIVIINGIIAGVIVSAMLALSLPLHENGILNYNSGTVVGYASMVIALSVIFFAIRRYREHLGGEITFGKAFGVGLAITVIASVIYAVTWEVCYHTIAGDFMARMTDYYVEEKIAAGATAEEVAATRKEMAEFSELYENPAIRFGMTLFEIFPVGLLITLISSVLLRQKNILPSVPPSA